MTVSNGIHLGAPQIGQQPHHPAHPCALVRPKVQVHQGEADAEDAYGNSSSLVRDKAQVSSPKSCPGSAPQEANESHWTPGHLQHGGLSQICQDHAQVRDSIGLGDGHGGDAQPGLIGV